MGNATIMSKLKKRKISEQERSSFNESDAQLLLSLSNSSENETLQQVIHQTDMNKNEDSSTKNSSQNGTEKAELNALNDELYKDNIKKLKSSIDRKDDQCQTNEVYIVSKEDYDFLRAIKAKGLTVHHLSRLALARERPTTNPQSEDVNNNTLSLNQADFHIPLIDLSIEDDPLIDEEIVNKLLNHSDRNKALVAKLYEKCRAKQSKIEVKPALTHVKRRVIESHLNVSNVIMEVLTNIEQRCQDSPYTLCFNKITQTHLSMLVEVGSSTNGEPNNTAKDGNNLALESAQKENAAKNFEIAKAWQLPNNMQNVGNDVPVRIQHIPISPVPDKPMYANSMQDIQQLMSHYKQQTPQPSLPFVNNYNYPNTMMMNALEQVSEQRLTHVNSNWTSNYVAEGVGPAMEQQHRFLPTPAPQSASFTMPQNRDAIKRSNTQGSNNQAFAMNMQQQNGQVWQAEENLRGQQKALRRFKNTPTRTAPYHGVSGPQFPAPAMGKYQMIMEQQKRSVFDQQKLWESVQNFPNTAWDQSLGPRALRPSFPQSKLV